MYLQTMLELPKTHQVSSEFVKIGSIQSIEVITFGLDCPVILWLNKEWKPLVDCPGDVEWMGCNFPYGCCQHQ